MVRLNPILAFVLIGCLAACTTVRPPEREAPALDAPAEAGGPPQRIDLTVDPELEARWREILAIMRPQMEPCLTRFRDRHRDQTVGVLETIIEFEQDGSLRHIEVVHDVQRLRTDADYRAVAEGFILALAECSPLEGMPTEWYDQWEYFPMFYRTGST